MPDSRLLASAVLAAGSTILLILLALTTLAAVLTGFLGLPPRVGLQPGLGLLGALLFAGGLALVIWLLRYRSPATMIVSTYFTFRKMLTGAALSDPKERKEELLTLGPQSHVRHPLYLGATAMFLGWALATDSTSLLVGAAFIFLLFRFVQIPFEEKELVAMFGEEYTRYARDVPMLFPRRKKRS